LARAGDKQKHCNMSIPSTLVFVLPLFAAVLVLAQSPPNSDADMSTTKLREAHIVPDVIDQLPSSALTVSEQFYQSFTINFTSDFNILYQLSKFQRFEVLTYSRMFRL
jgi:hypothetical protein